MNYKRFKKAFHNWVGEHEHTLLEGWNPTFYDAGSVGQTDEEKKIILDCNIDYYKDEGEALRADFFMIMRGGALARFRLLDLRDRFNDGGWGEIFQQIKGNIDKINEVQSEIGDLPNADDFETIKNRLIVRLLNYEKNKLALKKAVYKRIGDMALVLYYRIKEEQNNLMSAKVYADTLEHWNMSLEEVWEFALDRAKQLYPPRLCESLQMMNTGYAKAYFMPEDAPNLKLPYPERIYTLTTDPPVNGATAIFYKGVKERIAELLGGSFYAAFTSWGEVAIHKADIWDADGIRNNVKENNKQWAEEAVSDMVYYYDTETGEFGPVAEGK
ncbi:MAG: hypothetical protein IJ679_05565 [Lachnospiraceae bacterium]|nr:hypothetical protein [Lachnospiraceae bacterium]